MIDESFSDEERQIVAAVARFIEKEVKPQVARFERERIYPEVLVEGMKKLGLFGIAVPEAFDGLGLRIPVFARVMEELAKGWTSLAAYVNSHSTVAYALSRYGTPEQKARFLPRMATGEMRAAICLTESGAGSDLQAIRTTAVRDRDGYLLNGNKIFITNGERASLLLVLAKTDPTAKKMSRTMSLMLVTKDMAGVSVPGTFHKMAFDVVDTVEINLEQVRLPADAVLGGETGSGFPQLMDALEAGRIAVAASAVGLAAAALGEAKRYAAERRAFGKTIDQHQAVQLRLADMATKLVAARLLVQAASSQKDKGVRADMLGAMAKLFASEACMEITQDTIRVLGGYGYVSEFPVERLFREAPLYVVGEGTNDIQRLVILRRMLDGSEASVLGLP